MRSISSYQRLIMEEMIARWIKETLNEYERAKLNQNLFKMDQMRELLNALRGIRDKLPKSRS